MTGGIGHAIPNGTSPDAPPPWSHGSLEELHQGNVGSVERSLLDVYPAQPGLTQAPINGDHYAGSGAMEYDDWQGGQQLPEPADWQEPLGGLPTGGNYAYQQPPLSHADQHQGEMGDGERAALEAQLREARAQWAHAISAQKLDRTTIASLRASLREAEDSTGRRASERVTKERARLNTTIKKLQDERDKAKREAEQASRDLKQTERRLEQDSADKLRRAKLDRTKLTKQLEQATAAVTKLEEENAELKSRVADHHSDLMQSQMKHIQTADEHDKLKLTYQKLLETHTSKIRDHKANSALLRAQSEKAERDSASLQSSTSAAISSLEKERDAALTELESARLTAKAANQELARHKSELRISNQRACVAAEDAALWRERYEAANTDVSQLRDAMNAQIAAYTELNVRAGHGGATPSSYDELQRQFESVTRQALEQKGQLVSVSAQALQNAQELERLKAAHEKEFGSLPISIQSPAARRELEAHGGLQVSIYTQSQTLNDDGDAVGDDGSSVATDSTMGQFPRPRRAAPTIPTALSSGGRSETILIRSDVPKRATTLAELEAELADGPTGGPRQLAREFKEERGEPKYVDAEALHGAIRAELNRASGSVKEAFRLFDTSARNRGLNADELREALASCGLTCTDEAFERLMTKGLDPSFSGDLLTYSDFVRAMMKVELGVKREEAARAVDALRHTHSAVSHANKTNEERLATYLKMMQDNGTLSADSLKTMKEKAPSVFAPVHLEADGGVTVRTGAASTRRRLSVSEFLGERA